MSKPPRFGRTPAQRRARRRALSAVGIVVLAVAGAALDPAIIAPFGPLAAHPERVGAHFTRCGQGTADYACVVDGDTLRFGTRSVRIIGIDAPELVSPKCPAEAALAERAAARLMVLVNQGQFDMTPHRFNQTDRFGRDLRVLTRGTQSIGATLIAEGLAHRYMGMKRSWC